MTELVIEETSGVDHPAHLHEGWLVVKAADTATVADVERALPEPLGEGMSEEVTETVAEDAEVRLEAAEVEAQEGEGGAGEGGMEDELAMAQARIAELEARIAEMESAAGEADMMEEAAEPSVEDLAKSASEPIRKMLLDLQKERDEAAAELQKERDDRADAEAVAKARETFKHLNVDAEKIGPALRRLELQDADLAKSVEEALAAADAQSESAGIFQEIGKAAPVATGDAYEKMTSLAKAAVSEGKAATVEQAIAEIAVSNPALYVDYLSEKGA
jgi:vacuolar-type H+-ATPase subunit I/STV1